MLSTATDLVFAGGREGYFFALDAKTGSLLWKSTVGGQVASGPMTYAVNGRQYVAVSAGNNLFVYALRLKGRPPSRSALRRGPPQPDGGGTVGLYRP